MHGIRLDKKSGTPLSRQIFEALRSAITSGQLQGGERLPSTRELGAALGVSRNTALEAYDMLLSEGYAQARRGSGTRVAQGLTLEGAFAEPDAPTSPSASPTARPPKPEVIDFRTGVPDLSLVPRGSWMRCLAEAERELRQELWGYSGPQGLESLRREIAAYVYRSRGIRAPWEHVFVTSGTTQSLHITASILGRGAHGTAVAVEDPCHIGLVQMLGRLGYEIRPVEADAHGMLTNILADCGKVAFVYATPSHQYPLGGVLPAARRAELIRFARSNGCYVLEDDYDSEFRYLGHPVSSLWEIDPERVIYAGTFSKSLFPSLRLGFVLLPQPLHRAWRQAKTDADVQNSTLEQAAFALFLNKRRLDRHVAAMRRVYAAKRQALVEALHEAFGDRFVPWGDSAGLHMVAQIRGLDMADVVPRAKERGVLVTPLERYALVKGRHTDKLILGYGNLAPQDVTKGVAALVKAATADE